MYLLNKYIYDVDENDIKHLRDFGIGESKTLDFKRELKIKDDKKGFLTDICAMANTEGGVIVYGIEEEMDENKKGTGVAGKIVGIPVQNKDILSQQIEETIQSNTDPKITTIGVHFVTVDGVEVLLVGVGKFIGLPYMLTLSNKFYKRRNTGNYPVDTKELNDLFMNNFILKDRANNFVKNRITEVLEGNIIGSLNRATPFFLHIIPLGHFEENVVDLTDVRNVQFLQPKLLNYFSSPGPLRYNLDGGISTSSDQKGICSYCQIFRDGTFEFYTSMFHTKIRDDEPTRLFGSSIEQIIFQSIESALEVYKHFSLEPPFAIFVSVLNTSGTVMLNDGREFMFRQTIIDRQSIVLPPLVITSTQSDLWQVLKPTFDILWQSGGYAKSPYYNDNGTRKT